MDNGSNVEQYEEVMGVPEHFIVGPSAVSQVKHQEGSISDIGNPLYSTEWTACTTVFETDWEIHEGGVCSA